MECSIGIPYTIPWIPLTMMNKDPYGKHQCKDLNASILPDSSEVELKSSGMGLDSTRF